MDDNMEILITIAGIVMVILFWVMLYDSNRFVIKKYETVDGRIKKPCRAVLLTDLHNKRYGKNNEKLLAAIRGQNPDFILVAGDLITARPKANLEPALQLLRNLAKEYPIYYGNGNHEHRIRLYPEVYGDMAQRYDKELKKTGITPMINSHVKLPQYGITIYGAEIDKYFYKRFKVGNMKQAYLSGVLGQASADCHTVLLAHNPDYFPQYAQWGADLVLSGHVHGGIMRVPFWGKGVLSPAIRLFPKYDGGIFQEGKTVMVLSRGLGTHTIPFRLFNPAELWVLEWKNSQVPRKES